MKRLLFFLLKQYIHVEKDRLKIYQILQESAINEYYAQSGIGNISNAYIEFIISNKLIRTVVKNNHTTAIGYIKEELKSTYSESINIIKEEELYD